MKLMTRTSARNAGFDCDAWSDCASTATLEKRVGLHDRYSVVISVRDNPKREAIFTQAVLLLNEYRIFPPHRMRHCVCSSDRRLRAGAVIIQRIFSGPLAAEMAVRVVDVFDRKTGEAETGFSYVTLTGHAERGVATFFVRRDRTGEITFNIESWSEPGNFVALLARPVARRLQRTYTAEALDYFRAACKQ